MWESGKEGHSFLFPQGQKTRCKLSCILWRRHMTSGWWASASDPIQVLKQHQWPPRAMHLSAVIFFKVSQSKKRVHFLPPRHRTAARFQKKRHSGAHHTLLWLFTIVLECCRGWELLEMCSWPDQQLKTDSVMLHCPKRTRRLPWRLSVLLVMCHAGFILQKTEVGVGPSLLAVHQTLLLHRVNVSELLFSDMQSRKCLLNFRSSAL